MRGMSKVGRKDKARVLVTVLLSVFLCYFGYLSLRKLCL